MYVLFIRNECMQVRMHLQLYVCMYVCMYIYNPFLCQPRRHCYSVCEVEEYNPCQLGEVIANPWHRSVQTTVTIKPRSVCMLYLFEHRNEYRIYLPSPQNKLPHKDHHKKAEDSEGEYLHAHGLLQSTSTQRQEYCSGNQISIIAHN